MLMVGCDCAEGCGLWHTHVLDFDSWDEQGNRAVNIGQGGTGVYYGRPIRDQIKVHIDYKALARALSEQ